MPFVQQLAILRSRTMDNFLDRDFDPFFHDLLYHPIDVLDHFDRDFDSLLDNPLDHPIDIFHDFDRHFDALLDELGFSGRKQEGPDEAPRRGSDQSYHNELSVDLRWGCFYFDNLSHKISDSVCL